MHHGHGYRIYADSETTHSSEQWVKGYEWLGGLQCRRDFREAYALAKLGSINCRMPFVVHAIPAGGKRQKYTDVWVVGS